MKNCQSIAAKEYFALSLALSHRMGEGRGKATRVAGVADGLSTRGAIEDCGPFDPPSRSGEIGAHGVARPTAAAVLSSCALELRTRGNARAGSHSGVVGMCGEDGDAVERF